MLEALRIGSWLPHAAAGACVCVAALLLVKDHRTFSQRCFAVGLGILAVEELLRGLTLDAITPQEILFWQNLRLGVFALLPGTWLVFSLVFARSDYRRHLVRWKYLILLAFVVPAITNNFVLGTFFSDLPGLLPPFEKHIPLGHAGRIFYFFLLIVSVLILMNLERTLRAATGRIRWQVKFVVLGVGCMSAVWIYISSQSLLYFFLDTSLGILHSAVVLASCALLVWGLVRSQYLNVDVYLSGAAICYSITVLLAGIYLIAVGLLARLVYYFNPDRPFPLQALLVLIALIGLAILLVSDRVQERIKRFVIRNLRKPAYDYRKAWMELTERTSASTEVKALCTETAKIISQTLGFLSINIWLLDESQRTLKLQGSTVFTRQQSVELSRSGEIVESLVQAVCGQSTPVDLAKTLLEWPADIMRSKPEFFKEFGMRYLLPIRSTGALVGILSLNDDRVGKAPLGIEDLDLLHAYTSQLAAGVRQLRLAEQIRQAKELEAFQRVSTFFMHDLKNLASRLSLTVRNLPVHFDNPEFRADALAVIRQSLSQIDIMCRRLSLLREGIEIKTDPVDLRELVSAVLNELRHGLTVPIDRDLKPVPRVRIDPEQFRKVLTNLFLNAQDAVNGQGVIRIGTSANASTVTVTVGDNGCGISREFMETSLFQPFQSTKERGMGIGLYQSRLIVEAHHGRIEVESEAGKGSIFRVIVPALKAPGDQAAVLQALEVSGVG